MTFASAITQGFSIEQIANMANCGYVSGCFCLDKYGVNREVTSGTDPEDIVEFGGRVVYDADGTAPIRFMSSSSAADVGQPISIQGLDIDGYLVDQIAVSNGQNNVELETPLWRVFRMENNADVGGDVNGVMYVHTDASPAGGVPGAGDIRAIIDGDHNQTLMAIYTVPRGYVGYLFRGEVGIEFEGTGFFSGNEYAHCHYESRRYGKCFKLKKALNLISEGDSNYNDNRSFKDIVPALTDIRLVADEVSATMGLFGTFDMLLVEERQIPEAFRQRIGQPS